MLWWRRGFKLSTTFPHSGYRSLLSPFKGISCLCSSGTGCPAWIAREHHLQVERASSSLKELRLQWPVFFTGSSCLCFFKIGVVSLCPFPATKTFQTSEIVAPQPCQLDLMQFHGLIFLFKHILTDFLVSHAVLHFPGSDTRCKSRKASEQTLTVKIQSKKAHSSSLPVLLVSGSFTPWAASLYFP